jgi:hypothetical protein
MPDLKGLRGELLEQCFCIRLSHLPLLIIVIFGFVIHPTPSSSASPRVRRSAFNVYPHASGWQFFLQSSFNSSRALKLHSFWKQLSLPPGLHFTYKFVNLLPQNTSDPPNLALPANLFNWKSHPNWAQRQWKFAHMSGLFWTFKYVLGETSAQWIFRSDDDILINFEMLLPYIREMETRYNPFTDVVIHGDCILNGAFYPQGGAGVLFSRRAIQKLMPLGNFSIWGLSDDCPDQRLGRLMAKLEIPKDQCPSSAFLGQPFRNSDRQRVINNDFTGLRACPPMTCVNRRCDQIIRPTRQLVFYHVGNALGRDGDELARRMNMAKSLWTGPKELAVMQLGASGRLLCWQTGELTLNGTFVLL